MRTLLHISDLHFGVIDPTLAGHLSAAFSAFDADLVIISGDLTQRARTEQFTAAKQILEDMKKAGMKYIVVPGNHDIEPFYNPIKRLLTPYTNYKKYISEDLEPRYQDEEIAVAGLNSVNRFAAKEGIVFRSQMKKAAAWLQSFPSSIKKIVVTHHPINNMNVAEGYDIDLYLSGHHHVSSAVLDSGVAVQAGTLSLRSRGELASFNVIRVDVATVTVETHLWNTEGKIFSKHSTKIFRKEGGEWKI
jgi:3',5'-cyclic AMP phosphodiesterase CpdA